MRRHQYIHVIPVLFCLAALCTAEKCDSDDVRDEIRKWNTKTGKALVTLDESWTAFYAAETDRIGDELIAEHADDPDWTEEEALEDFEAATAEIQKADARYQASKMAIKHGLEANEQILDAWEHGEGEAVAACIKDVTKALYDLVELFLATGLDVPNIVQTVIASGENLMEVIHTPDFTDPKDD